MRKVFAAIALLAAMAITSASAEVYPMCGVATHVEEGEEGQLVEVRMFDGAQDGFSFYAEYADYAEGDIIAFIMDDMGTGYTSDDEIIDARYCGFIW